MDGHAPTRICQTRRDRRKKEDEIGVTRRLRVWLRIGKGSSGQVDARSGKGGRRLDGMEVGSRRHVACLVLREAGAIPGHPQETVSEAEVLDAAQYFATT